LRFGPQLLWLSAFREPNSRGASQNRAVNLVTALAIFAGVVVGFFLSLIAVLVIAARADRHWNGDE
jgi:hypothetical protein